VKILFLNGTAALGGAERLLLDLLASLAEAEPRPALHLVVGEDGPLAELAAAGGAEVSVLPLPRRLREVGDSALSLGTPPQAWHGGVPLVPRGLLAGWAAWRYAGPLRRLLDAVGADVVHSNSLKLHLLAALAGRTRAPLVWHLHDFVGGRAVMRRMLRWAAPRAAGAVAVSHAVADDAVCHLGSVPVVVVPNAIDTERFSPGASRGRWLDEEAGLPLGPAETVRIGLVATYARWKGQDVFLDAATRLLRRRPDLPARFFVVGGPIYQTRGSQWSREELQRRVSSSRIENRIGFIDFQTDVAPVHRSLDVVVHASSRPEPFGLTIAEAMACGRAVVVARGGGAAELFTHDHDAVGFPPGDSEALAAVLESLVEDPLRRRRLSAEARATAQSRFARARLGPQVLAAYRFFFNERSQEPVTRRIDPPRGRSQAGSARTG
jgi:glycosyltransferase involved in cell wall biosynthesis